MATGEVLSVYGGYPTVEFASIFYAMMDSPLAIWDRQERGGLIRRVMDEKYPALELFNAGNVYPTFISAPCTPFTTLGITLPHVVFIIKNINKNFAFAIQIRDEVCKRRFLFSNSYRTSRIKTFTSHIPVSLGRGWNELTLDLASLTQKAYGTTYQETVRVQVHANCQLRLIYFSAESMQTLEAADMMKKILTSLKDNADAKNSNPSSSDSSQSASSTPLLQLLIPPDSKPGPPSPRHTAAMEDIEPGDEPLPWRQQLSIVNAKSAVFEAVEGLGTSVLGTKSCPQLGFETHLEMKQIIEEMLVRLGFAMEVEEVKKTHDSVNANEIVAMDLELSADGSGVKEPEIASASNPQDSPPGPVGQHETALEQQIVEVQPAEVEKGCKIPKEDVGMVADRTGSPPPEVADERKKLTTMLSNNLDLSWKSSGSLLDLDVQLSELEFVVKGMLKSCPNLNSSTCSTSPEASSRNSQTHSSMTQMQVRIDEMKSKLNRLEECVHSAQWLQLTGDATQTPRTPAMSPPSTADLSARSGSAEPLILGVNLSGILRAPGAGASLPKLKRNLSVRFSKGIDEEKGDPNVASSDSKDTSPVAAASGGVFDYFNPSALLNSLRLASRPFTK